MRIIHNWFLRVLSDTQLVILLVVLGISSTVVLTMGRMLAPALAGLVLAYLLEGVVHRLQDLRLPRLTAVLTVFSLFMAASTVLLVVLLPLLSRQIKQLIEQMPAMFARGVDLLMSLPAHYPALVSEAQVRDIATVLRSELGSIAPNVLSWSIASVTGLITVLIYLVLVPLLVFFFLKDKDRILAWFRAFLPADHSLARSVWRDIDRQIANYVRGKFWEVVVVWSACVVAFTVLGLQFAMLLGLMVGLSVIVPYIGAVVVTFPVAFIAFFQWGWGSDFIWLMTAYAIIQGIDGNVLVPLLFSEVTDLHPIAIIVAVLVFGGLWGFWGIFFAIPLATVVQAVLKAWPHTDGSERQRPLGAGGEA